MRSYSFKKLARRKLISKMIMALNCMSLLLGSFVTVVHAEGQVSKTDTQAVYKQIR